MKKYYYLSVQTAITSEEHATKAVCGIFATKKRRKSAHAHYLPFKMTVKERACAVFVAIFVAKILQTAVCSRASLKLQTSKLATEQVLLPFLCGKISSNTIIGPLKSP